jgi:hypothetical protein
MERQQQVQGMRMAPDQKYSNQQALSGKRAKAQSGLGQFTNQGLHANGQISSTQSIEKQTKLRQ